MPLHKRVSPQDEMLESVYAGNDLLMTLPANQFPTDQMKALDAFQAISDELLLDGNSRQNIATFCQTWEEAEVHRLMDLAMNKNMIDKDEYPQTAEIERRCVHMLADLWHAPEAPTPVGSSAIGSSEACMLGGMAAKWRWRANREADGKPTDKPNMVCGPVQVVWHKFARYWDVEMREVPMAPGRYAMDAEQMLARVDENTIMVVPDLRGDLHRLVRTGARALEGTRRAGWSGPDSTSTSTSTGPAGPSSPRSARPRSSSTSGSPGSSPSARRATSSASPPSAWAGCSGATPPTCPRT